LTLHYIQFLALETYISDSSGMGFVRPFWWVLAVTVK